MHVVYFEINGKNFQGHVVDQHKNHAMVRCATDNTAYMVPDDCYTTASDEEALLYIMQMKHHGR